MKKTIVICFMTCFILLFLQACNVSVGTAPAANTQESVAADTLDGKSEEVPETKVQEEIQEEPAEENTQENDEAAASKPDLKEVLKDTAKVKDDEIASFYQDDFDGDGIEEAFALVGTRTEFDEDPDTGGIIEGNVWFVGQDDSMKLTELSGMGFYAEGRIMTLGRKYIMFDEAYATGALTYVWNVSGGQPVESEISMLGTIISDPEKEDRFCIMDSSYDLEYDAEIDVILGHTWKYYYFYYDSDKDEIHEYGGTDIDEMTADKLYGSPFVKDLLLPGDIQNDLFYRGNGLIVLNFERPDGDNKTYYHYIYDLEKDSFIDDEGRETDKEPLGGTYLKALRPDMATSPEVPDIE